MLAFWSWALYTTHISSPFLDCIIKHALDVSTSIDMICDMKLYIGCALDHNCHWYKCRRKNLFHYLRLYNNLPRIHHSHRKYYNSLKNKNTACLHWNIAGYVILLLSNIVLILLILRQIEIELCTIGSNCQMRSLHWEVKIMKCLAFCGNLTGCILRFTHVESRTNPQSFIWFPLCVLQGESVAVAATFNVPSSARTKRQVDKKHTRAF